MAVVTHGSSLPDSSQKTDFYSIIDNATVSSIISADISASAGIMDTQLNTISTAGKVNTSSLTGQIANANLAQLTTAALVTGSALTLLGNIPSGAGTIPAVNLPFSCSTQTFPTRSFGSIYQNTTGKTIVVAVTTSSAGQRNIVSDSSASPSTVVGYCGVGAGSGSTTTFLVLPNNYYEVLSGLTLAQWVEWV